MSNRGLLVLCAVLSPALVAADSPRVRPLAECVVDHGDGSYTAHFGYDNEEGRVVTIPVGFDNLLFLGPADRGQPTVFQPVRTSETDGGFTVRFAALHWPQSPFGFVAWKLGFRVAWVWAHSPRCSSPLGTPDAADDTATTPLNRSVTVPVLANDSDPQGDTLSVDRVSTPGHGTAILNSDGTITYTPAAGYAGTDSFTYTVSDGNTGTDQATVTVTVSDQVPPPNLLTGRLGHTATLLADGEVLVAGGSGAAAALGNAEIFDPQAHTVAALAGTLQTARQDHTATLLPRGEAFLFAGTDSGASLATAEVYSPSTQTFEALSAYTGNPRSGHTATLLLDGRVLILGGLDSAGPTAQTEAFDARPDPFSGGIFDPRAGTFIPLPHALLVPRLNHTATLLPNGQVLIVGGEDEAGDLASAELFDPVSGDSALLSASLGTPRTAHTATLTSGGTVLIAGGAHDGAVLGSIEAYAPASQTFSPLATTLSTPRAEHTATLLATGEVWIAGGHGASGVLSSSEMLALSGPDTVPPQIRATLPVSGAEGVALNAIFSIRFSEPLNPATINATTVRLADPAGEVAGAATIGEGGLYAFFVPDGLLSLDTTYTLTLAGVRDLAGNLLPAAVLTYRTSVPPVIDGVAPDHGPAGAAFSLTGSGFDPLPERNRVSLGGVPASVTAASTTSLACIVPADTAVGPTPISLQTPGGWTEAADRFTVEYPSPTVTAVSPPEIVQGTPGVVISVTGSGFLSASTVSFGGAPVPTGFVSASELTAALPVSVLTTAGTFPVLVTNPAPGGGASNSVDIVIVPAAVVALSVAPVKASLIAGEERTLFVTALLSNGLADDLTSTATWASSDTGVATVNAGVVVAHGAGLATITAMTSGFTASATVEVTPADPIPPDPATVAPPLELAVATTIDKAGEFLYAGQNPIQRGVAPNAIDPARAAILRGRVVDANASPLPGVTITIFGHSELGRTQSRTDGVFDMAVNGGGPLTARYDKAGYLSVDRQIEVPWQDWAWLPDVVMITRDPQMTTVNLTSPEVQVARGTILSDEDGTRQATLLFVPGTQATLEFPDGTAQPLGLLHVRATEFTVGSRGPERMPAQLPPASVYTYAAELGAEEGIGASRVSFSQPVVLYIENFLGNDVGIGVPLGYYNRTRGVWEASYDGRVVRVLSIASGLAALDLDGDGLEDGPDTLAALSITEGERQRLAALYSPGQGLWRFEIPHLTSWDCNYAGIPPAGATAPGRKPPRTKKKRCEEDCEEPMSVIGALNRTLRESLPVTGTPFSLNYSSLRASSAAQVSIELTGPAIPDSLERVDLEVVIAGQVLRSSYPPAPNLTHALSWDGKDGYGRSVQGPQPVRVKLGYVYRVGYLGDSTTNQARLEGFGRTIWESGADFTIAGGSARPGAELVVYQAWDATNDMPRVGWWNAANETLGGWTLSVHHRYDPRTRTLFRGDGTEQGAVEWRLVVPTVAGTGSQGYGGDGGPARDAQLNMPLGIAVGPDGSLYVADTYNHRIRRIGPDGIITTVAGTGQPECGAGAGDGGPATQAGLCGPESVAVGPDGDLYITEWASRLRRVKPDGVITTVDNVWGMNHVATGRDGNVYLSDGGGKVYRLSPTGILTTLWNARAFQGISSAGDGSLLLISQHQVMRRGPDGSVSVVAGTGEGGFSGDGGPALEARLQTPWAATQGPDGSVYIADQQGLRIRRVLPTGLIVSVAGTETWGYGGENGLAGAATFAGIQSSAMRPDGRLVVADSSNNRIRALDAPFPRYWEARATDIVIPDEDGLYFHAFDPSGRHRDTFRADTGALVYRFGYDERARLISVEDGDSNITQILRDATGTTTTIVAPGGQQTTLAVDSDGYLTSVSNPAGEAVQLTPSTTGLLTSLTDPKGGTHTFTYDAEGLLVRDQDPAGGSKTLTPTAIGTTLTTGMGRSRTYTLEELPTGDQRRTFTDNAGLVTAGQVHRDGTTTLTSPDGTTTSVTLGPDPRWGMQSALPKAFTLRLPSGLTVGMTSNRAVSLADPGNPHTLLSQTDTLSVNGRTFTSVFTTADRRRVTTSPAGRQWFQILDSRGRVVESHVPGLTPVLYEYDTKGRLTAVLQGTRSLAIAWDDQNRPQRLTDSLLRETRLDYDAADRVTKEALPGSRQIGFGVDLNGNITTVTPPGRPAHILDYTSVDLKSSYTPPDVGNGSAVTSYSWDLDRDPTQYTRPDGRALGFGYDGRGRLTTLTSPEGQTSYTYDPASGNLASITGPGGNGLSFSYDGSVLTGKSWTGSLTGAIRRTLDENLRMTSETVNGSTVTYAYDDDGLLTRAGDLTIAHSPQNGLTTGTTLGSVTDSYSYNDYGEVSRYTARFGATELFDVQYTRDDLGRITQRIETVDSITRAFEYGYDDAGRLANVRRNGEIIGAWTYDPNGNRLSAGGEQGFFTGTYNDRDQLLTYGDARYSYSPAGETVSKVAGGQTTSYSYDTSGMLTGATLSDGRTVEYVLDASGWRVGKRVDGVVRQRRIYGQSLEVLAELDDAGQVTARFVFVNPLGSAAYITKAGRTYRIITDHLGSARVVVDATSGEIVQRLDYDAWGQILQDSNPGFQPFSWTGREWDSDLQAYYYRTRYCDPKLSRFTSEDPIGFRGGLNAYQYALNDPVSLIDPYGLQVDKNLFPPGSEEKRAANKYSNKADPSYTVAGHGNQSDPGGSRAGVIDYRDRADPRALSAKDLADIIRNDPNWKGRRIKLLVCWGGKGNLAEELAKELRVPVEATPDTLTWVDNDNLMPDYFVGPKGEGTNRWRTAPAPE